MSQIQFENTEKLTIKKVHFTGTDVLRAGYALCYDADYGTASASDPSRVYKVEKPATANLRFFAGVVSEKWDGKKGPITVEVYVPTARGQGVPVWTNQNCTIIATKLAVTNASFALGAEGVANGNVAEALQTVDRSGTAGTVLARLGVAPVVTTAALGAQTQAAGDMSGGGADALTNAEQTKINGHLDAIKVDVGADRAKINLILVALKSAGIMLR